MPLTTGKADSQEKGVRIHATTSSSVSIDNRHFYCTLPKYFQKNQISEKGYILIDNVKRPRKTQHQSYLHRTNLDI